MEYVYVCAYVKVSMVEVMSLVSLLKTVRVFLFFVLD